MGLVEHIHPSLAEIDFKQSHVKLAFIVGSFVFFSGIYLVSTVISAMTETYRNLRTKEKIFWHLAIVRAIYGIFCIIVGTWAVFFDTELQKDVSLATTPTSHIAMTTTVGFFVFECSMIMWSDIYYKQFNVLLNLHHWLALVAYTLVVYYDSTHYFGCRGLTLEMTTPFSCLCWTLLKADMAQSLLWKANQYLLVHMFHLRSVVECHMWYVSYIFWDRIWSAMPTPIFISLYLQLVLVTFVMTPYWTYKKTAQMITPVDWNFEDTNKNKEQNGMIKQE